MSTPTLELQRSIYGVLTGVLSVPVYDEPPEGASMPYVVIGDITETPALSHNVDGREVLVTVHVWSAYAGAAEAREIAGEVIGTLHRQRITVTGWQPVLLLLEFFDVLRDPGGVVRHGVIRLRGTVYPQ